ncbi:hypothetical protein Ari01nite_72300 [Paractinoplanes rishiriensis]|uniref:Uncharacterized protein n=1 Tax=Paractinoplanes rishiriensis TaxID=1050105 RepID=A0A919K2Y8_9ACTN|nr:hypothetical protein Ari01nite_72300 [Actinoplanes rishiriensis]
MRRNQNVRIILRQVDFPQLNGTLQHSTRPSQIATTDESLRALPGRQKRGRLRHARHAARNVPEMPVARAYALVCPDPHPPCISPEGPCTVLSCAARRAADTRWVIGGGVGRLPVQVRVAEWQTR